MSIPPKKERRSTPLLISQKEIREAIIIRLDEYEITQREICEEFKLAGMILPRTSLSRYLNYGSVRSSLTEKQVVCLCKILNISIALGISLKNVSSTKEDRVKRLKSFIEWVNSNGGQMMISGKRDTIIPEKGFGASRLPTQTSKAQKIKKQLREQKPKS